MRVTPQYDAQKSPVSGSVVYNKTRGSFKIGKERKKKKKKKSCADKRPREDIMNPQ